MQVFIIVIIKGKVLVFMLNSIFEPSFSERTKKNLNYRVKMLFILFAALKTAVKKLKSV